MATPSIEETRFFGRGDLLQLMDKRLRAHADGYRQNLAFLGPPLVGKTLLVCQGLQSVPLHAVLPMYLEVREEPVTEFVHRFLAAGLAQAVGTIPASPSAETLELLLREAASRLPQITTEAQRLRGWAEKGRWTEAFGGLFDWLHTVSQETGKPVCLVLDEFHHLAAYDVRHPLAELGKRIMVEKRVMYLVTSSRPTIARTMLQEQLHLLFGHFEIIDVPPFDPATSRALLRHRLDGLELPESVATFLSAWTGGHPFYLDHFARCLEQLARSQRATVIAPELVSTAAWQLLGEVQGVFHRHWQTQLQALDLDHRTSALSALVALAHGRLTVKELGHRCQRSPQETNRLVHRLAELHVVTRLGHCVAIEDPLFRFWLLSVHEPLRWSPVAPCAILATSFQQDVEAAFHTHERERQRPAVDRLIELLHAFQDDRVDIDQRMRQLPRFMDVRPNGTHPSGTHVYAKTRTQHWVYCVKTQGVATESDIRSFDQACRALAPKPQRKIFVALDGIEPNATLLAKEARMWTWERPTLNALLVLYGKSPIIG